MYVELDTSQTTRKQLDLDVSTLKSELSRLSGEKMASFDQLRQLMADNEAQQRQIVAHQAASQEQTSRIEKLKSEKEALNKELVETKMRTAREKEELAQSLEQIEKEIVKREREMYAKQYEQVLVQSCEAVRADEARKYAVLSDQLKQKLDLQTS